MIYCFVVIEMMTHGWKEPASLKRVQPFSWCWGTLRFSFSNSKYRRKIDHSRRVIQEVSKKKRSWRSRRKKGLLIIHLWNNRFFLAGPKTLAAPEQPPHLQPYANITRVNESTGAQGIIVDSTQKIFCVAHFSSLVLSLSQSPTLQIPSNGSFWPTIKTR